MMRIQLAKNDALQELVASLAIEEENSDVVLATMEQLIHHAHNLLIQPHSVKAKCIKSCKPGLN